MARPSILLATSAVLLFLLTTGAQASPLSWQEEMLAATAPSIAAAAAASSPASSPAKNSNKNTNSKKPTPVPAVSVALASSEGTISWNAAKGEYECASTQPTGGDAAGSSSRCSVITNEGLIAVFVTCGEGQVVTGPSCYQLTPGVAPSVVYGWFVRGQTVACGFTVPPQPGNAPFKLGASAYCMTVMAFDAPRGGGKQVHRGM
jgi:hypothetical protein